MTRPSQILAGQPFSARVHQFYQLTKPRVVSLIVFTAVIGMLLAATGAAPVTGYTVSSYMSLSGNLLPNGDLSAWPTSPGSPLISAMSTRTTRPTPSAPSSLGTRSRRRAIEHGA